MSHGKWLETSSKAISTTLCHYWRLVTPWGGTLVSFQGWPPLTALLIILSWGPWPICNSTSTRPCLPCLRAAVAGPAPPAESRVRLIAGLRRRNHVDSLRPGSFHPLSFISPPIHFSFKKVTQYAPSPRGQNAPSISPRVVRLWRFTQPRPGAGLVG